MPRANRCYLPDHVWHITHRCHKQEFLLGTKQDRENWSRWLLEAKKRYGLTVLNYIATSNHIHLLVYSKGSAEISKSMQLIAGRTAQEFNSRNKRKGAFWEDRYHAVAIDIETYLFHCMVYIDLNMVRSGVVDHPSQWDISGYNEIQNMEVEAPIIDLDQLVMFSNVKTHEDLRKLHLAWHEKSEIINCNWTKSIAVGSLEFVEDVKRKLGISMRYRKIRDYGRVVTLREPLTQYNSTSSSQLHEVN